MIQTLIDSPAEIQKPLSEQKQLDGHVVVLTNFIPPYDVKFLEAVARRVKKLTILISTSMESNRDWQPDWGSLDVRVQKTSTFLRPWKHSTGFSDTIHLHLPWDTISQLRKLNPDIIISHEMGLRSIFSALYRNIFASSSGKKLIVRTHLSEHTEQGRGWIRKCIRKWIVRQADWMTANGQSGSQYLQALGARKECIELIPYVPDPAILHNGPLDRSESQATRLLYVGQFIERKGVVPFVKELASWADTHPERKLELNLVGSGPQEADLRNLAVPENLQLRFLGSCYAEQLAREYANCGIYVMPTLADEWALVVHEAMHAGLPVLGSVYSQAVEELINEDVNGWKYQPDIAGDTIRVLDKALNTPADKLEAMRVAARESVKYLTPEYAADRLLAVMQSVENP